MKKAIYGWAVLGFLFCVQGAFASDYRYTWSCADNACSFSANPVSNALSYYWDFGDDPFASATGQNATHTYDWPGSGTMTTRVTLTYHLSNGLYKNARCYITWYEPGVGPPIGPEIIQGICDGFN